MKTYITKVATVFAFLAVFSVGVFGVTHSAQAFVSFNNDPQDYATLRAINATKYPNSSNWISTTVSADAGDTISFDIYYHNTGTTTANNTRIKMSPSTTGPTEGTSFNYTATITADGYSGISDSVTIAISSPQTMAYIPGSAVWFPNQTTQQTIGDSELFTSGINIGNIAPGWSTQGYLRVQYLISKDTVATATCNDDLDNDGDGFVDYPADPDCTSNTDSENVFNGQILATCNDHLDNDGDGYIDYGGYNGYASDPDCTSYTDFENVFNGQTVYTCNDHLDNDGDGYIDYGGYNGYASDPDCTSFNDSENLYNGSNNTNLTVTTNYPTNITDTSAVLQGYLNTNNTSYSNVTRWFEWGTSNSTYNLANTVYASGTQSYSGSFNYSLYGLSSNHVYYYKACAQSTSSSSGPVCGQVLSFTTTGGIIYSNVSVTTTPASSITQSSAVLNALVLNSSNDSVTGWFEYGTTTSMGKYSTQQVLGTNSTLSFFNTVTGLSSNTTYYFRAVARANDGTLKYGQILSFRTLSTSVAPAPIVIHTGTVIGTGNGNGDIMLTIDSRYENVYVGDIIDYTVIYKNISGRTLQNAILRVILPQDISYRNSSTGFFSNADNALTIELGSLIPNQTGTYYLSGQVAGVARYGDTLVATANLVYTNTNGAQQEATAYEINHVNNVRNALAGLAFLAGFGFFPNSLFGWLLLLLIILALVYLARRLYMSRRPGPTGPMFS
ncbi:hypothetical protein IPF86_01480 [Candidatus Nomurabacteria bacterium]|nr:MAG: hypothetical protein IPF86_01480 [Candidatus Nomurabacteria bacterium]